MAATNVREFRVGLEQFRNRAKEDRRKIVRAAALHALRDVVLNTRVDTGRARGNWQVGESVPPEGHDPELKDADGGSTIGRGSQVIAEASGDETIWLHNGVPYVGYLEDGPVVQDKMVAGAAEALRMWLQSQSQGG
jgi:hypothetical protein